MEDRKAERRLITALFVDVVGSTELQMKVGPERLKRALDQAFAEIRDLIVGQGGTVEKYIGDAVFAIFGAPTSHADDPARARRAAAACVEWAEGAKDRPIPLGVRLGAETGEALVDIRKRHPNAGTRELRLRLASRRLDPEIMTRVYGWDPRVEGY